MYREAWNDNARPSGVLGAIAHGPAMLATAPGLSVALGHIAALPEGFEFDILLWADGDAVTAIASQQDDGTPPTSWDRHGIVSTSELTVLITLDGETAAPVEIGGTSESDDRSLRAQQLAWVGKLPSDGVATFTIGWPEVGLATVDLDLTLDLADLEQRIVRVDPTELHPL